jgi:glucuronate isomerase
MRHDTLIAELIEGLASIPLMDAHTHLSGGRLSARGAHDILLYHMLVSDLYAAGCPSGHRLTEFPGWPTKEEAHARMREALPYLPYIRNTSCFWGARTILRDLYGWRKPVTEQNWKELDDLVRERADDHAWQRKVMGKANIAKFTTELQRRGKGDDDDILHYSMEWAFFTRTQRGEFDTALYELERCWGKQPGSPIAHGTSGRPPADRTIRTLADVHAAMDHFVTQLAGAPVISIATHISTDIVFRRVSDEDMTAALGRRDKAGVAERDTYAAYVHELFLTKLEPYADRIVFQPSFGAEPLPHETASLVPQRAMQELAEIAARHPKVRIVMLVASRHANQTLCTLCRELPNVALAGYWWHNFFPGAIRQVMEERLDMLPLNRQVGFFSDAYCIEWSYAKATIIRNLLAQVLAQKVQQGQFTKAEALDVARVLCFQTPQELLKMEPLRE